MKKQTFTLIILTLAFFIQSSAQVNIDRSIILTGSGSNARLEGIGRVQSYSDAASADYIQRDSLTFAIATGSSNAYAVGLSPAVTGQYTVGMIIHFIANFTNTGPATLTVNALSADTIMKNYNGNLASGDIQNGQAVSVIFDGTHFQMLTQLGNSLNATTWGLTGNTGTNANNDFLGTIDSTDLVLRTDNTERARIKASGSLLVDNSIQLTGSGTNARVEGIGRVQSYSDAASVDYIQKDSLTFGPDGGSANAYSATLSPAPSYSSYPTGIVVSFKAANSNTGASTLAVNGLSTANIMKNYNLSLAANDIKAGQIVTVMFDGTNFQMLTQLGNSSAFSDFTFPEGISWSSLLIENNLSSSAYSVPSGDDLYILSWFDNSGTLTVGGNTIFAAPSNGSSNGYNGGLSMPVIAGAGTAIGSSSNTTTFTGFLIPASGTITPITQAVNSSSTYTVPSTKTLYILNFYSGVSTNLLLGGKTIFGGFSATGTGTSGMSPLPIMVPGGTVVSGSSSSNNGVFNGYLK